MTEVADLQRQIRALEAQKPSADTDPSGHRRVNDEITRLCDQIRRLSAPVSRKGFV